MLQLVKVLKFFRQLVNSRFLDPKSTLIVLVSQFSRKFIFGRLVIKRTNVEFVATRLITLHVLVLVRMVQSFDRTVTLGTLEPQWTLVPAEVSNESFTVFRHVAEQIGRSSKIACMVRINARFRVVGVFFCGTPTGFVVEHEKDVAFLTSQQIIQILV